MTARRPASRPHKAVRAVPAPAPEPDGQQPEDAPAQPEPTPDTRTIQPSSLINALQASLNEKADQIRRLEDRVVLLNAVIAEQDGEITELRKTRAARRSKPTF